MAKGLTVDEKRKRLLDLFSETRDFFVLKEVEKMGAKRGIVLLTVKDTLQSLVDDDLVRQEKIGNSNFFWAFPSEQIVQRNKALAKLEKEHCDLLKRIEALKSKLEEERCSRVDENRIKLIGEYESLLREKNTVDDSLKKYSYCDPEKFLEKRARVAALKEETNKITEDLFTVQGYVTNRFGIDKREFCETFNLDQNLDYV